MLNIYSLIRNFTSLINLKRVALSISHCSLCTSQRIFIKFNDNEVAVRCLSCGSSPIILSLITVLKSTFPDLSCKHGYELSARGRLVKFLRKNCEQLTCSEFYDGVAPGKIVKGVQCQDVQNLTFKNDSFDFCTSTEVFEHVPDDSKGFAEIYRVLKPLGLFMFTVPIDTAVTTVERAVLLPNGDIKYLQTAEFHGNPIQRSQPILAYRNYGYDILDKLRTVGFKQAKFVQTGADGPWGYSRTIIVAVKGAPV